MATNSQFVLASDLAGAAAMAPRVAMLDLASVVPYYTGHLAAALLNRDDVRLEVAAIGYHLDPGYWDRQGVTARTRVIDTVSSLRVRAAGVRHLFRAVEYLLNAAAMVGRCWYGQFDLVHIQFLPLMKTGLSIELQLMRMMQRAGVKIVYTVHNVLPQDTGERHKARYAALYRAVDWLICHDENSRDRLVNEFELDAKRISVIPHGPLLEDSRPVDVEHLRRQWNVPPEACLVMFQGILRRYKGADLLLEAWQAVERAQVPAVLVIAGSGDQELLDELRTQAASLGSAIHLEFRFLSSHELSDFLGSADILVYPYREITTSGALMTALSRGKAIVASRLPAFKQVLTHGESGWLVTPGDAADLAAALVHLIGDPKLRQRLGERAANAHYQGPRWSDIASDTAAVYNACWHAVGA